MTIKFICAAFFVAFSFSASAQQQTESQCKRNVDATLQAIEMVSQQKGEESRLKDLSAKDIREIQQQKGSCEAMREINRRTMK